MHQVIRRKDRALDDAASLALLQSGEYGVLSTVDATGQAYGTPLSYVFLDNKIYFHCAEQGHKINNLEQNAKVCFTVVGAVQAAYDKDFTTYYESVVVFGEASKILDYDEKFKSLNELARKYLPEHMDKAHESITKSIGRTAIFAISAERITGKAKVKK